MGNNSSTTSQQQQHQVNKKPQATPAGHHQVARKSKDDLPLRRDLKRQSINAGHSPSQSKATAAPPTASLESAVGQPAARGEAGKSTASQSRPRSSTDPTAVLIPRTSIEIAMGNEPSKPVRDVSRSNSVKDKSSRRQSAHVEAPSPKARPIDAPAPKPESTFVSSSLNPSAPPTEVYTLPSSYSRPPRLPLPIEEELHTPGSPILSPSIPIISDAAISDVDVKELNDELTRRGSIISSTVDDEEEPDEFQGYMPDVGANVPKVPTMIEWRDATPEDKVYVTGTFMNWEKKYRLHWNGPSKHANALSATLQLPPGTHHLRFLVNNEMTLSPHLPTTVDFTNFLVNYIEVVQPVTPPAVTASVPSKPLDIRNKQALDAPSPIKTSSPATKQATSAPSPTTSQARSSPKPGKTTAVPQLAPPKVYTRRIPTYLSDLDNYPATTDSPDSSPDVNSATSRFHRANAAAAALPPPPSLPLFLNKSILNSATPTKDDASVLVLPNHTVLNHVATTNIRAGVLAVSATTRYKKRFLTTILFKPRSDVKG